MPNYALSTTPDGHQWLERREPHFRIETGETVVHHRCLLCGRDLVTVLSSGRRHAVYVSALLFYRLDEEVTERWLNEACPCKRLPSDDEDRNRQIVRILKSWPLTATPTSSRLRKKAP
jgi:hypothetical protein